MAAHYDAVTWLFVSRNFKDDVKDREAARTHDRFGITSWPQLILFDPRDDKVLDEMPRGFEPWVRALQPLRNAVPKAGEAEQAALATLLRAQALAPKDAAGAAALAEPLAANEDPAGVWLAARELLRTLRGDERTPMQRLQDPDVRERALALEALADAGGEAAAGAVEPATALLRDGGQNIVVRLRALALLCKVKPALVAAHAGELLAVPNDGFRNLVLQQLAAHPDPQLAPQLAAMFAGAGHKVPSRNPNVLRSHVARCLGKSGDASAIDAVAGIVREANPRNGTTRAVVAALGELAPRLGDADRARAFALLLDGLPAALGEDATDVDRRLLKPLLADLHKALAAAGGAELPAPPAGWSAADRAQYVQAVRKAARR